MCNKKKIAIVPIIVVSLIIVEKDKTTRKNKETKKCKS